MEVVMSICSVVLIALVLGLSGCVDVTINDSGHATGNRAPAYEKPTYDPPKKPQLAEQEQSARKPASSKPNPKVHDGKEVSGGQAPARSVHKLIVSQDPSQQVQAPAIPAPQQGIVPSTTPVEQDVRTQPRPSPVQPPVALPPQNIPAVGEGMM